MRGRRRLALAAAAVMLAGCGGSDAATTTTVLATTSPPTTVAPPTTTATTSAPTTAAPPTTTATTSAPTTTAPPTTTTTTAPTTTPTAAPPVFAVGTPSLFPPDSVLPDDVARGSGCSPGGTALPDGIWFGWVVERDFEGVVFDLACFYFGPAAYDEGAKDGEEVANDLYIRNANPNTRFVPIADDVDIWTIEAVDLSFYDVPFSVWPDAAGGYVCPSEEFCGVWLYVNGGTVTEVMEQYLP